MKNYRAQHKSGEKAARAREGAGQADTHKWSWILRVSFVMVLFGLAVPVQAQSQLIDKDSTYIQTEEWEFGLGFLEKLDVSQIRAFGDYSLKEALVRVPGVQVSRDQQINMRGIGYQNLALEFNGQRVANSGLGTRNNDLGAFSTDAFQSIEIIKVLDPSMDADALAGVINVNSREPVAEGREVHAIAGGGANPEYISRTGPSTRGWLNYSERYTDAFGVNINLSYQQEMSGLEELGIGYGLADIGNGPIDVVNSLSPSLRTNERGRFATTVEAHFDPTEQTSYYFKGLLNVQDRDLTSHRDTWAPNDGWTSPDSANGEEGAFTHTASMQDINTTTFAFQLGGENDMDNMILSYQAGWTQSNVENQSYEFPFMLEGLDYSLDWQDRKYPQLSITNRETQVLDDGTVDRQFLIGQDFNRVIEDHTQNEFSARVDLEYPIDAGSIKTGASARLSTKDGEYDENDFEYNRTLRMISFNMLREPNRNVDVINGEYQIPWFVNTGNARAFLEDQRPLFTGNENLNAYQSQIRNYEVGEQIYAAYAMTDLSFGKLGIKGGLRVEYDQADYTGNEVLFDEDGDFVVSQKAEESESQFRLFPNAQFLFSITEGSQLRAAYSRSIDRPDYYQLVPFERIHNLDSTIFRGNPGLKPVTADNIDLMVEQKIATSGMISIGGFYKELSDFTVLREQVQGDGFLLREYANSSNTATVYGLEVELAQQLSFLPGLLRNFDVYGNYTWSQSDYDTDRGELAFPGQSPHVVNAAMGYTLQRFSARVAYHWTDEILANIDEEQELAPSISSAPVYMDRYEEGYQDLSVTAEYQLSDRFRAWANVQNILGFDQEAYQNSQQYYTNSIYMRSGLEIRVGVRFDL
ncbi:TonB-dependent receptor [Gracilimonas mengyeensis]|uniref:TonB-dependent receptor n=1 Tax=Gracilimonas mengyeensis TaxID=1302730 RepID=A0A521FDF9_9BACT|nr:TonB-dependent receptor [Gracilimonas mengyeensis]SMO94216.1 TonB-dependent receptor [Gracilimonas mengyeensis]